MKPWMHPKGWAEWGQKAQHVRRCKRQSGKVKGGRCAALGGGGGQGSGRERPRDVSPGSSRDSESRVAADVQGEKGPQRFTAVLRPRALQRPEVHLGEEPPGNPQAARAGLAQVGGRRTQASLRRSGERGRGSGTPGLLAEWGTGRDSGPPRHVSAPR